MDSRGSCTQPNEFEHQQQGETEVSKNIWATLVFLSVALTFAGSSVLIGAHLAAPSSPPPPAGVYIAAFASSLMLAALVVAARRSRERMLKTQVDNAAQRKLAER
ncbi:MULTISPECIES: hypothetical protein [Mycobacteriaceae]|uniref:hypothetical protein n=1 Tax=Mycobacteriaceae TaxID=1762 RepID=UPI00104268AD|nr:MULTISPECIES: hypothetical protein [Mycobacteriaceae]